MADIFMIKATQCERCGGILTSSFGLKHGMGHTCKQKYDIEHAPTDPDQYTFFEEEQNAENSCKNDRNHS